MLPDPGFSQVPPHLEDGGSSLDALPCNQQKANSNRLKYCGKLLAQGTQRSKGWEGFRQSLIRLHYDSPLQEGRHFLPRYSLIESSHLE